MAEVQRARVRLRRRGVELLLHRLQPLLQRGQLAAQVRQRDAAGGLERLQVRPHVEHVRHLVLQHLDEVVQQRGLAVARLGGRQLHLRRKEGRKAARASAGKKRREGGVVVERNVSEQQARRVGL